MDTSTDPASRRQTQAKTKRRVQTRARAGGGTFGGEERSRLDVERCPAPGRPASGRELLLLPAGPPALGRVDYVDVPASDDVARDENVPHLNEALPFIVQVDSAGNGWAVRGKRRRAGEKKSSMRSPTKRKREKGGLIASDTGKACPCSLSFASRTTWFDRSIRESSFSVFCGTQCDRKGTGRGKENLRFTT